MIIESAKAGRWLYDKGAGSPL
ncbi:DUF1493 family protein [Enterobacter cloacae complex sp. P12RS]|nr:DUF1493 family protein [Enterobacter cloacae complex sp. P12RS]MBO0403810.1 DUF1493 family protein [Enterobacter bugandensis]